ncbi:hypothetical protein TIFTF001_029079 [Ficus carica]|uniref:Uncharacterized protein n=1 Tax=Ficus carica TaxID=3494 RepID=A0AA88DQX1_FICCA|nr:hypothetical protein TIFTF001_029079 [Ficus carica]
MTGRMGVTGRGLVGRAGDVLTGTGQAQGARVLGGGSLVARVLGGAGPAGAGRALVTWSGPASKKCSLDFWTDLTETGQAGPEILVRTSEQFCSLFFWTGLTGPSVWPVQKSSKDLCSLVQIGFSGPA